jgi:multidrug resistance efflux pump
MKKNEPEILYSEPIREIMGSPPGIILRWGTVVIFLVIFFFLFFSWVIRYPEKIIAPIEITTINPPVTLVSKISGNIKYLYVRDRENVPAGKVLAVMETTSSLDEISLLEKVIDSLKSPESLLPGSLPVLTELGELQAYFGTFQKNLIDFHNFESNDYYGHKISSLSFEIKKLMEYIGKLNEKERLFSENRELEAKKFRRDSLLYADNVIPVNELERSTQSYIRLNIELQQVRLDQSEKAIELAEKQQLLNDYRINRTEESGKYYSVLEESFLNLKAQLNIWKNNYLLISPVEGRVSFTRFWNSNQSVLKEEPVLTIVPDDSGDTIGRIKLKMDRSGKVRNGQMVFIKLSSFPYLEYGMLNGKVKSKSLLPTDDTYIIEVSFPEGLVTLYGKKLEFTQKMQGSAEVITDDVRLLQRIFNPVRYLVARNKRE